MNSNKSEVLLVLDDVYTDSIVMSFRFKSSRYRILVTSRTNFPQFRTYKLDPLDPQHAAKLFRRSSFSENESDQNDARNDLVEKVEYVKYFST